MSSENKKVEKAIHLFYNGNEPLEQQAAHEWLVEVQKSVEGWQVCWVLLDQTKDVTVQYYGAVMLYYKISHNLVDLDNTQYAQLKRKTLMLCLNYLDNQKLIFSKLCSGFAALLILTSAENLNLTDCLDWIERTANEISVDSAKFLLEFLVALPCEFKKLKSLPSKKLLARNFIEKDLLTVLNISKNVLDQGMEQYQESVLSSLLLWLEFGIPVMTVMEFVPALLSKLVQLETAVKASEVLVEIVTSPTIFTSETLIFNILEQVTALEKHFEVVFAEDQTDLLEHYCILFASLGETHSRLFCKATSTGYQQNVFSLVRNLLKFTSAKGHFPVDEAYSELTFNFWYSLQDELYSLDTEIMTGYQTQLRETYKSLLEVFFTKCQLPPDDIYSSFSSDEKERLRCYRIDIQDAMLYMCTLLQGECLMFFQNKLLLLCRDASASWHAFECALYLLKGVVESVDAMESEYLPTIITMLESIPKHPRIVNSTVQLLGSLSEWLLCHPDTIKLILPFILEGLDHVKLQTTCSISLREICQECVPVFTEEMKNAIIDKVVTCIASCATSRKVNLRLYNICALVASSLASVPVISHYLDIVIVPLLNWLQRAINTQNKVDIIYYLTCFHAFFEEIEQSSSCELHISLPVYSQLLPLLQQLHLYSREEDVVVAIMLCISKAVEVGGQTLGDSVSVTIDIVEKFFMAYPWGCVIDSITTLVSFFGSTEQFSQSLRELFEKMCSVCIMLLNNSNYNPDSMQSLMNCGTRVLKTSPNFIYDNFELTKGLLLCAVKLLNFPELPTLKNSTYFLVAFLNTSSVFENGLKCIELVGQEILLECLSCIGGGCPRHTTDLFAEILLAFNKNYVTLLAVWFHNVLTKEGFPTKSVTLLQKEQFQKAVLRERANKRRMKDMVKEFSLHCRGIHDTEYVK